MKTNEACSGTGEAELWFPGSKPCAPPALSYARFLEQPMLGKRAFHQIQCASSFLSKGLLHMQMGSSGWKKFPYKCHSASFHIFLSSSWSQVRICVTLLHHILRNHLMYSSQTSYYFKKMNRMVQNGTVNLLSSIRPSGFVPSFHNVLQ